MTTPGMTSSPDSAGPSDPTDAPATNEVKSWARHFRDRLIEGLLVALPLVVTLWVFHYIYRLLELYVIDPLAVLVLWKVRNVKRAPELPFWFENYAAPIIAIFIALGILYLCGILAHSRLRKNMDSFLSRVPLVSLVYDAVRNVLRNLEKPKNGPVSPQRMVLVPFPHPGMQLPAIVTSSCKDVETGRTILCVYVPTTPVPASGFFLMIPEDEVTELNWQVPEALQTIISGGLSAPASVSYFSPQKAAQWQASISAGVPGVANNPTGDRVS